MVLLLLLPLCDSLDCPHLCPTSLPQPRPCRRVSALPPSVLLEAKGHLIPPDYLLVAPTPPSMRGRQGAWQAELASTPHHLLLSLPQHQPQQPPCWPSDTLGACAGCDPRPRHQSPRDPHTQFPPGSLCSTVTFTKEPTPDHSARRSSHLRPFPLLHVFYCNSSFNKLLIYSLN